MSDGAGLIVQLFNRAFDSLATSKNVCPVVDVIRRKSLIISSKTSDAVLKTFTSEPVQQQSIVYLKSRKAQNDFNPSIAT